MTPLPTASGKAVLKALLNAGYTTSRIRGSHYYLRREGLARLVVVPVHGNRDLPAGTMRSIIGQAGLTNDEMIRPLSA